MNLNCPTPLADSVTVINAIDRGELDDFFFPADSTTTIFSPDNLQAKSLPFTTTVVEYVHKGAPSYGGSVTFEIGSGGAGAGDIDLLLNTYVQVELDHWLPDYIRRDLNAGIISYSTISGEPAWTYVNSLGTALIESASFQIGELEVERIDGTYAHMWSLYGPDANTQFGVCTDGLGVKPASALRERRNPFLYPTLNGTIACLLPFSYGRARRSAAFPIAACSDSARIVVRFRPFHEIVQCVTGPQACVSTGPGAGTGPLGKTYVFDNINGSTLTYTTPTQIPQPRRVTLVAYGALTHGKFRSALLRRPFEKMYREVYSYVFDEPLKYTVNKVGDQVSVQLPLELNNPCEEILWVIRRRAAVDAGEWTNYSAVPFWSVDPVYNPVGPALVRASVYINGQPIAENEPESYYRRCVSEAHKGGITPYNAYVYGYVFSRRPGERQPVGHVNMSRAVDVKLALTVELPADGLDQEWSVHVYAHCMNWMRFENGIANRLYSS
jgi:hypothetical protein